METVQKLKEEFRGCVRVTWFAYDSSAGRKHAIEISAWNAWAGQSKLLFATTGLGSECARTWFHELTRSIADYDWMEGNFVPAVVK